MQKRENKLDNEISEIFIDLLIAIMENIIHSSINYPEQRARENDQ